MAAGKINLQANDTRIYEITAEDGAGSNVDVVIPKEGGTLATEAYAVAKSGGTMTGNLNFSGTGLRITGDFSNATNNDRLAFQTSITDGSTLLVAKPNGVGSTSGWYAYSSSDASNSSYSGISNTGVVMNLVSGKTGTGSYLPTVFYTGGAERLRIDTSGNVLVTGSGGLGYGTGSGGTVTQLTSKSTAVTLNKPSGRIVTHNASLAAGATVIFQVNNSLVLTTETINVILLDNSNYDVKVTWNTTGAFVVKITNTTGSPLSEAVNIHFNITKGAIV